MSPEAEIAMLKCALAAANERESTLLMIVRGLEAEIERLTAEQLSFIPHD